jgi:hypothetical protein
MVPYFVAALYLGCVAWRTGSLVMPMGLHFANNGWNALFANAKGDVIVTPAPFIGPYISLGVFIGYAICQAVLVCCVVEWVMRRRGDASASRPARCECAELPRIVSPQLRGANSQIGQTASLSG